MKKASRARKTPKALDERLRLMVESVQDYAIFMLDTEGHVLTWNRGAEAIKGYTAEEIVGHHFSRFYPPEALERGWPEYELERARERGRFEDEGWRVRKDGSKFWANVIITALRGASGELLGFSKVTRDLSERRQHEEELRQSEERFRLLVESVQDYAIFMLDPSGRVVSWNRGAERIHGYVSHEIVGKHITAFYPEDARKRGWPEHELAVAGRTGRFEDEGWRVRKDGSRFWASVVINALQGPEGQVLGFAKLTRDLTERKRIEALELEGRRINEFIAMLGHELRNPLGPIRNAVILLQDDQLDPARARWARALIERQVRHLERIVDDLLDVGRVSTGRIAVRREPMDLVDVVSRAVDSVRSQYVEKAQHLDLERRAAELPLVGDDTRLAQVVLNLLTNAHKYTPEGGHVRVLLERDGRFAQLRVVDDGNGIAPGLLPHLFDLFVQGNRTLDRAEGGLGIGLTLVRRLVELHGGTVSASSPGPGQGSEFVVRLPLVEQDPRGLEEEVVPEEVEGRRVVLVVDDNQDSAESLAMLLRLWGHEAHTSNDGPDALEQVESLDPDIVLLDIGLPGMSGYEVANRLRGARAAVIAMTGYGQAEDVERSRAAGCVAHLVKPVDLSELRQLLEDYGG